MHLLMFSIVNRSLNDQISKLKRKDLNDKSMIKNSLYLIESKINMDSKKNYKSNPMIYYLIN